MSSSFAPCSKAIDLYSKRDFSAALREANRCLRNLRAEAKKRRRQKEAHAEIVAQMAAIQRMVGDIHLMYGRLKDARSAYQEALKSFNKLHDKKAQEGAAEIEYSLGATWQYSGRLDEALKHYKSSADLFAELGVFAAELRARLDIGKIIGVTGSREEALACFEEVAKSTKKVKDKSKRRVLEGDAWFGVAECQKLHDAEIAEKAFMKARKLYSKAKSRKREGSVMLGLAQLAHERGDLAVSEALVVETLQFTKKHDNSKGHAAALRLMAVMEIDKGNYMDALNYLESNLSIARNLDDRLGEAEGMLEIARIIAIADRSEQNVGTMDEAVAITKRSQRIFKQLGLDAKLAKSYEILSILEDRRGNGSECLECLRESRKHFKHAGASSDEARVTHRLIGCYLREGDQLSAFRLFESNLNVFGANLSPPLLVATHAKMAALALNLGEIRKARKHARVAEGMLEQLGVHADAPITGVDEDQTTDGYDEKASQSQSPSGQQKTEEGLQDAARIVREVMQHLAGCDPTLGEEEEEEPEEKQ